MRTEANDIINSAREYLAEYLEMTSLPDQMMIFYLASQVAQLSNTISYLEKLAYVRS